MQNDDLFNYLVATDQLDDFLGYKGNDFQNLDNELDNSDNDEIEDIETDDIEENEEEEN